MLSKFTLVSVLAIFSGSSAAAVTPFIDSVKLKVFQPFRTMMLNFDSLTT